MAGLLDILNKLTPNQAASMGLLNMGANMMQASAPSATPNNFLGSLGAGISGFGQSYAATKAEEDALALQDRKELRQSKLDDATINKDNASADYYRSGGAEKGVTSPSWSYQSTPNGIFKGNIHSPDGNLEQVTDTNGMPIMRAKDSIEHQTNMANSLEGQKVGNVTLPDGSVVPMQHSQSVPSMQQPPPIQSGNNNPGNIKNLDGNGFQSFASPEQGTQALSNQIGIYTSKHGITNLRDFTNRYAPKGDGNNDPEAYAQFLAKHLNVPVDSQLDFTNPQINAGMVSGITRMEGNGKSGGDKIIQASNPYNKQGATAAAIDAKDGTPSAKAARNQADLLIQAGDNLKRVAKAASEIGQSTVSKLAAETDAKRQQAEQDAAIKLKNAAPLANAEKTGAIQGENSANAQSAYPKAIDEANDALSKIDEILKHPGLNKGTGLNAAFFDKIPGTDAYDFKVQHENLTGKVFVQAFNSLRGAGAITDAEGKAATSAITTINDRKQSTESYVKGLAQLKDVVERGKLRAGEKSGISQPAASNSAHLSDDDLLNLYRSK